MIIVTFIYYNVNYNTYYNLKYYILYYKNKKQGQELLNIVYINL